MQLKLSQKWIDKSNCKKSKWFPSQDFQIKIPQKSTQCTLRGQNTDTRINFLVQNQFTRKELNFSTIQIHANRQYWTRTTQPKHSKMGSSLNYVLNASGFNLLPRCSIYGRFLRSQLFALIPDTIFAVFPRPFPPGLFQKGNPKRDPVDLQCMDFKTKARDRLIWKLFWGDILKEGKCGGSLEVVPNIEQIKPGLVTFYLVGAKWWSYLEHWRRLQQRKYRRWWFLV